MGCERCDAFDAEVAIPTPGVLRSVAEKVRLAVHDGNIRRPVAAKAGPAYGERVALAELSLRYLGMTTRLARA
jgi:hypothetical protein